MAANPASLALTGASFPCGVVSGVHATARGMIPCGSRSRTNVVIRFLDFLYLGQREAPQGINPDG